MAVLTPRDPKLDNATDQEAARIQLARRRLTAFGQRLMGSRYEVARFPADTDQIVLPGEPRLQDSVQLRLYYQMNRINFASSEQSKIL